MVTMTNICTILWLSMMLRPGNKHASYGAASVLKRIIPKLKEAFPKAEIIIRGDAGFAAPDMYDPNPAITISND